ncbi:MAG: transcription antitermination factor NusB [Gammaproteobacteria bacterium]|nr:transcription antitermination factor NusB [Gammaproteobacteria bacterium]MDH3429890.1 transcription antitermination factor NusB [Gammaproteobacteria bacterium]MDH3433904.1 transcription antitermination factor NusB [Gammaproteobacteria bacterium]
MTHTESTGARTRARELLVQALYQKQIAGHACDELLEQFHEQTAYDRVDKDFFDEALPFICRSQAELEQKIDALIDRPLAQLDPVELSVLLIGVYELESRVDVPYRVVINEGVNLAKRFGALDGHKYINACLDVAAQTLRSEEVKTQQRGRV